MKTKVKTLDDVIADTNSFTGRVARMHNLANPAEQLQQSRLTPKEKALLKKSLAASKKKTKINLTNIPERDECQTPPYALLPLLPYLPPEWIVWEHAAGSGLMAEAIHQLNGNTVVETDLLTGTDFFTVDITTLGVDVLITNPPGSLKYQWMQRCYDLGKPFALLMPIDVNGAAVAQAMFQKYGFNVIYMDKRINYKMPYKGWSHKELNPETGKMVTKGTADFSSAWYCWGLPYMTSQVIFGHIPTLKNLPDWMVRPDDRKDIVKGMKKWRKENPNQRLNSSRYD